MKTKKLVVALDNGSVTLSQLATLLNAQQDELTSCDSKMGGNSDNWAYKDNQIEVIGNIVMKELKELSHNYSKLSNEAYSTGKFDN